VQQWEQRRKLFKSKAVSCKVHRNTETVIIRFFCCPGRISEMQNFFLNLRHISLIKPYVDSCACSWALGICKNMEIRTYFGWDHRRPNLCGVSTTVRFVQKYPDLPLFLLHLRSACFEARCIFWGASFEPIKLYPMTSHYQWVMSHRGASFEPIKIQLWVPA